MNKNSPLIFSQLYDKYSTMLYSIAVEISPTEKQAEEILIITFKKAHKLNLVAQTYPSLCITLIKIIIQTAHEHLGEFKNNFRLKQFENTPLLNHLICDQISLQDYCKEKYLTQQEGLQIIRKEFSTIRNAEKENKVSTHISMPTESTLA